MYREHALSDTEAQILIEVRERGRIDNSAVRRFSGLDTLETSKLLRKLTKLDILEQRGKASKTYYVLHRNDPGSKGVDVHSSDESFRHKDESYRNKGESLRHKDESFRHKDESFRHKDASFRHSDLPQELQDRLDSLGRRASQKVLEDLIVELCALAAMSRKELALSLRRSERHIERYLSTLVNEGRIRKTELLSPTHPHQSYRAARDSHE